MFVVAVIILFLIIGYKVGLLKTLLGFSSTLLSMVLSMILYHPLTELLKQTFLFGSIKNGIFNSIYTEGSTSGSVDDVLGNLPLPEFMKTQVSGNIDGAIHDSVKAIYESISEALAYVALSIISMILIFILVRVGLLLLKGVANGITSIVIIKQINKLGGIAIGFLEGLLILYVIFAVLIMFNSFGSGSAIHTEIQQSFIAKIIYENNFLVNFTKG